LIGIAMKQALLVIDVQRGLFAAGRRPFDAVAVIDRINSLTARARAKGIAVIFVQHEHPGSPLQFGAENWRLEEHLVVCERDTFLRKSTPDSFLRTNLGDLLAEWHIEQLVICGYASEFCVDTTTRRAAALGYAVILVADAHTTHDKPHASGAEIRAHHNATLSSLRFGPAVEATPAADVILN
jgi:nicotinamidase-related amidase